MGDRNVDRIPSSPSTPEAIAIQIRRQSQLNREVTRSESLIGSGIENAVFNGLSFVTFDYGKNIGSVDPHSAYSLASTT